MDINNSPAHKFLGGKKLNVSVFHIKRMVFAASILIYPALLALLIAYVQHDSLEASLLNTLSWPVEHFGRFLINYLLLLSLVIFLLALMLRVFWVFLLTNAVFLLLSSVNYFKFALRGEPLIPSDFTLGSEATNIAAATNLPVPKALYVFAFSVLLISLMAWFIKTPPIFKKARSYFLFGSLSGIILLIFLIWPNQHNWNKLGIQNEFWSQEYNYRKNGLVGGFLMQLRYAITVDTPADYSREVAIHTLGKYASSSKPQKPNIIMVLNESFWDPSLLPGTVFSSDPLEEFRKLQKESLYGNLVVEPFGGNTANTEFEILTGFNMQNLPTGSSAYQQYLQHMKNDIPSLPNNLKKLGYATTAIHPYDKAFWARDEVYPLLGFDNYYGQEDKFTDDDIKGDFVSDSAVIDEVINDYRRMEGKNTSYFAQVVTMQNHGSYRADRYDQYPNSLTVTNPALNQESLAALRTYAIGVEDASKSLRKLTDYFRNVSEPTIVVFYGDHLPAIDADFTVYKDSGYIDKNVALANIKSVTSLYRTPFIVWRNYSKDSNDLGTIDAALLTPSIISAENIPSNPYFNFLIRDYDPTESSSINMQKSLQHYYLFDQ